jgi:hypothetical protein
VAYKQKGAPCCATAIGHAASPPGPLRRVESAPRNFPLRLQEEKKRDVYVFEQVTSRRVQSPEIEASECDHSRNPMAGITPALVLLVVASQSIVTDCFQPVSTYVARDYHTRVAASKPSRLCLSGVSVTAQTPAMQTGGTSAQPRARVGQRPCRTVLGSDDSPGGFQDLLLSRRTINDFEDKLPEGWEAALESAGAYVSR